MRILLSSHVFSPSIGGIEQVSALLAAEFVRQGHEVRLITQTEGTVNGDHTFAVYRRPSAMKLLELVRWCDIFFHNNISLTRAWPLLLIRRPWVVAHHVWLPRSGLVPRLKRYLLRFATCISISRAVADHLATQSTVIPNPYDHRRFLTIDQIEKRRDLIFVGRLVSDKGVDLLLAAVAALAARGLHATVTVVGDGPDAPALQNRSAALGLTTNVWFAGSRRGSGLVRLLNEHCILVIPSRWQEPFGLVALEGIACGCVPVGSSGGGLAEAIGDCGMTFPNGDVDALADALEQLLRNPARRWTLRQAAERHLRRHTRDVVAAQYLRVFSEALEASGARARQGAPNV